MTLNHLLQIAGVLLLLYALVSGIYLVLENRSPQSTFAWLFFFITIPVLGVVVYQFVGRGWRAFSKENQLARQELGGELLRDLRPITEREGEYIARLAGERPNSYRSKLLRIVQRNASSLLTGHNEVAILQDASQKYPLLLADIRAARHHIHLNYYIWTEDSFTVEVKEALIERARAGVVVRCLYDASGGALSRGYLQELRDAGVAIHPYLEYRSFIRLHSINYRSHRKIAVIDGRIGYTGGLNLDKEQLQYRGSFPILARYPPADHRRGGAGLAGEFRGQLVQHHRGRGGRAGLLPAGRGRAIPAGADHAERTRFAVAGDPPALFPDDRRGREDDPPPIALLHPG